MTRGVLLATLTLGEARRNDERMNAVEAISNEANERIHVVAERIGKRYGFVVSEARLGLFMLAVAPGYGAAADLRPLFASWEKAEWEALAEAADNEVMLTWITHRLSIDSLGCEKSVLDAMNAKSALRRRWNRVIGLAAIDLCDRLHKHGVYATLLKGAPLSLLCYGDADLRDVRDIDLLVSPADAYDAGLILVSAGYTCEFATEWLQDPTALATMRQVSFRSLNGALEVDLHWKVANEWLDAAANRLELAEDTQNTSVFGRKIVALTPSACRLVAEANVAGSHRVEMKASVDYLRLTLSSEEHRAPRTLASPPTPTIKAGLANDDVIAKLLTLRKPARLPTKAVCRDLLAEPEAHPDTRRAVWVRNLLRLRSTKALFALLRVAGSPTKAFYQHSQPTKNNGTHSGAITLLRKILR